jgi:hypothetical protein
MRPTIWTRSQQEVSFPAQRCLWLNDEKRSFPGSNYFCQKYQEHPVGLFEYGSFDLSAEDDDLLAEECVFCHEFGLASGLARGWWLSAVSMLQEKR